MEGWGGCDDELGERPLVSARKSASRRATTRVFTDRQSEYLLYSSMSIDPQGLQAWVTSNGNDGGNMKAALSRDTDTVEGGRERGGGGCAWWLSWSKINVFAIPKTPVFKSQRRRMSEEKGGLIGEGCWELGARQQGRSGRRKDGGGEGRHGWMPTSGR